MYRSHCYRGGPVLMSAIAGIDQALWDIKGQALGVPVYEPLGGQVRDWRTEELDDVVNKDDFRIAAGYIHALPRPGLGVEIDEDRVLHASRKPTDWPNPVWRHPDGSVAEW